MNGHEADISDELTEYIINFKQKTSFSPNYVHISCRTTLTVVFGLSEFLKAQYQNTTVSGFHKERKHPQL